jgi:uncharacterized LabA/DUF88 family protein
MMGISQPPGPAGISRVMVFIDGGYVRAGLKKMFGDEKMNYRAFAESLAKSTKLDWIHPQLVRAYYYDAPSSKSEPDHKDRLEYLKGIRGRDFLEVRLGRLRRSSKKGRQQKGVDTLIAIDMLTKAYQNHYDVAVLVTGDDDFRDLVKAVKNAGKSVYGAYFMTSVSLRLSQNFDRRLFLTKELIEQLRRSGI